MLHLNFGQKIFFCVLAVSGLAVLIVVVPLLLNYADQYKAAAKNQARIQATMISKMIGPAIEFDREDMASAILELLRESESVKSAVIYTPVDNNEFKVFATYGDESLNGAFVKPAQDGVTIEFANGYLESVSPVISEGNTVGYLKTKVSLNQIQEQYRKSIVLFVVAGGISGLIAVYLAFASRRSIIKPLASLIDIIRGIAETKDYSQRAEKVTDDEVGELINSFNSMLDVVQNYDQERKLKEDEIVQLNLGLEKKVEERTIELENSMSVLEKTVRDLKDTQSKLVEQEKMASLGSLVAGVAHEINTPIGVAITASSHLKQCSKDMSEKFLSGGLTKNDFTDFVAELSEGTIMIGKNLERAAELIKSFKMVAVDQSNDDVRDFDIKEYFESVLLSLKPKLKRTSHNVVLDIPNPINVVSSPGALSQIITNLIMNSLIHGFENKEQGTIEIRVHQENDHIHFHYFDDGKGIPDHMRQTIFDPFVTSARHKGGSGLGTHVLYNLVTQVLGGHVYLRDKEGPGVYFFMEFPTHIKSSNDLYSVSSG